ncbi:putative membrane protein [Antricoccus suffuscus]|uniref:Putative membrane protein n=1 Tax=Antricoccus suffuscus TaxID=1629062 RepID=A0A2T1A022_9ACTN|nr:YhgE/Pip domain-containing protein [Antricoccus suffuscus]PRZ41956.1 putative membrane protein [Antricoccus suffuscus]
MIALRLAFNELRRITTGKLPKLAIAAMLLVPVLYSATYLYANWDPYGKLQNVDAAIVNSDQQITESDGTIVHAGADVATELKTSDTFKFHVVSAETAAKGVEDGTYAFSLTIPSTFSRELTSAENFKPQQATLKVTTNDANNYLVGTIADKVSSSVRSTVASTIGEESANKFLLGFSDVHSQLLKAADGADQLAAGAAQLASGADQLTDGAAQAASGASALATAQQQLADGANQLNSGSGALADGANALATGTSTLADGLGQLEAATQGLPSSAAQLADGAQQVAAGNAQLAQYSATLANAVNQAVADAPAVRAQLTQSLVDAGVPADQVAAITAALDQLINPISQGVAQLQVANGKIQQLGTGASQVADGAAQLADSAPSLASGIAQASEGAAAANSGAAELASGAAKLHSGAGQLADGEQQAVTGTDKLADGTSQLASGAGEVSTGAHKLADGAGELSSQLRSGAGEVPNPDASTRAKTADQIGNPLEVQNTAVSSAGNYGAGLAPFFLALSMWIGSFVLFLLVRPLSNRALASGASAFQIAFGGWLPSAVIGIGQAIVVYVVATALVGIDPTYGWLTFGILAAAALSFTALLHGINAKFGAIGKFIGLVLLILQLVSAGGTFPWQTIPGPLHILHQILPLGYVVDALRHTIYGAYLPALGTDLMVLGIYLVLGLALSTWAARSDRRWSLKRLRPELVL